MKLLYVDIDGPLATDECSSKKEQTKWRDALYRMNDNCVSILNEIIQETGCDMIVSSDWRHYFTIEELGEIFEWNGIIKKPIGITSDERRSFFDLDINRGYQIKKSVDELKPEKWVAIDDLFLKNLIENFVYCDPIDGLCGKGVKQQVINFLI